MAGAGVPNLAQKLQHLFRTIPQSEGRGFYTNDAMVRELADRGVAITVQHLSNLRNGRRDNPSARLLAEISDVFGVPMSYFFNPEEESRVNTELEALTQLRRANGLRVRGDLDAQGLLQLMAALRTIERLEEHDDQGD